MNKFIVLVLCYLIMCVNASPVNYRQQSIKHAQKITRPLNIPNVPKPIIKTLDKMGINHQAIKVTTDTGKKYVISNNPKNGIHVTDSALSKQWTVKKDIKVNGDKKIGQVLSNANGVGNGLTSYITGGTCIGTAASVEAELSK